MRKRVKIEVFNILKSIVDSRVVGLPDVVRAGHEAYAHLPDLEDELKNLSAWERREARYGRPKYEPGEKTPDDYVSEIEAAKCAISAGCDAADELKAADQFYVTHRIAMNTPKIQQLEKELSSEQCWLAHWQAKLSSMESNQDDDGVSERGHCEMEYERVQNRIHDIQKKLAELQR